MNETKGVEGYDSRSIDGAAVTVRDSQISTVGPPLAFSNTTPMPSASPASAAYLTGRINWSRIWKYTLLSFGATFVVGLCIGVVAGIMAAGSKPSVREWSQSALLGFATIAAVLLVFVRFTFKQEERPLLHVLIVGFVTWLISFANVLLLGLPLMQWVSQIFLILVVCLISVPIGLSLRARAEIARLKIPPAELNGQADPTICLTKRVNPRQV